MNNRKTLSIIVMVVAFAFICNACSKAKNSPVEPVVNNEQIISQDLPDSLEAGYDSRTVLVAYEARIDPVERTFTVTPLDRSSQYHFPLTNIFPNVLQITDYGWTPNFWADIKLEHPLPGSGTDAFDPRVIAILPANPGVSMDYPVTDVLANNSVILEPDGYTELFDSIAPGIIGNTNPFIAYFKNEPNRVWSSTQTTEETKRWEMNLSGFGGPLSFVLVVDISTNYPDAPQPIIDNALVPVQMETYIEHDLLTTGEGSPIEVTLLDWQGESDIFCRLESPSLFDAINLEYSRPGPNPDEYIFTGTIINYNLASEGDYDVLVIGWDLPTDRRIFTETSVRVNASTVTDGNLIWAKRAGGVDKEEAHGITTLSDNSTVVTGFFKGTSTFGSGETNETVLVSAGGEDIFVARYNPDGTLAWAKRAGSSFRFSENGIGITSLSDDSIVVTGYFAEQATFGPSEINETVLTSNGGFDIFIARYNPDGTLLWAKSAGGELDDYGCGITTLSDNSFVVTGWYKESAVFGKDEVNETILPHAWRQQIFIAHYNSNGTLQRVISEGGDSYDFAREITSLSDDSIVVAGNFIGSTIFAEGEVNEVALYAPAFDLSAMFIARYNNDGTFAWAKSAGWVDDSFKCGVTTLSDDSTVITGNFKLLATFGAGEPNEITLTTSSPDNRDIFIARYNPDGTLAWAKSAGGVSQTWGDGITTLSDDSLVVTGTFFHGAFFGEGEINETLLFNPWSYTAFVARYNTNGTLAWAKRTGKDDHGLCFSKTITSLSDDSIAVAGYFNLTVIFGPGEPNQTIYTSITGKNDIFIARFQP